MKIVLRDENKTLKERRLSLTLSDYEAEEILRLTISSGTTLEELLADFIGDLVNGYHSSGSDERRLAKEYFDRLSYPHSLQNQETFLQWSLKHGYFEELEELFKEYEDEKNIPEPDTNIIEMCIYEIDEFFEMYCQSLDEDRAKIVYRNKEIRRVQDFIKKRDDLLKVL